MRRTYKKPRSRVPRSRSGCPEHKWTLEKNEDGKRSAFCPLCKSRYSEGERMFGYIALMQGWDCD